MRNLIGLLCLMLLSATPALAATQSELCPDGLTHIRVSTIKPGGSRAGFDKAVADQIKWYRAKGFTRNRIVTVDVIDVQADGSATASASQIMTIHYNTPDTIKSLRDAGFDAFVKEFNDNVDITFEKAVCLSR